MIIKKEFWTSKQRQSSSLHEVPYRACFKSEIPNYFIKNYTVKDDIVYDPFSGRGTTGIESALLDRIPFFNDINPISKNLTEPRLNIPLLHDLEERLEYIFKNTKINNFKTELEMFFHYDTEKELCILKKHFKNGLDYIDKWIRFVTTTRLTGHSKGYCSVYTLPPNQAVTKERQIKINNKLKQVPEYRNVKDIIIKKTKQLLRKINIQQIYKLRNIHKQCIFLNKDAYNTPEIPNNSIDLIITSPPFLNIVQYANDNWLRCWFNDININEIENKITVLNSLDKWNTFIYKTLKELYRILKPNKHIAFEVGEIKNGTIKLDEEVLPLFKKIGFKYIQTMVNTQTFTKTSNIWGVKNNKKGTNTNRILLLKK